MFSEPDIIKGFNFMIVNIFVMFGESDLITNCVPRLGDLFLYSYDAYFIKGLLKKIEKKLARTFTLTFRYYFKLGDLLIAYTPLNLK